MNSPFLRQLISGTNPPEQIEFNAFLDRVMNGEITRQEVIAFLAGLSAKPLDAENVFNFVSYVSRISPPKRLYGTEKAVNIVGTGGGVKTFNISTAAAFVASAAGATVLKSGSAAYSSQCGSLDVLNALGVTIPEDEAVLTDMLGDLGIAFIPVSHYSVLLRRLVAKVLPLEFRDIGGFVNTVGPLICPYQVSGQLIGVGQDRQLEVFSDVVTRLKLRKTLLVHSDLGMDEFCSLGDNYYHLVDTDIQRFLMSLRDVALGKDSMNCLAGGDATKNAAILREVLAGHRKGAAQDTVVLNSAALLFVAGVTSTIAAGVQRATDVIEDGTAIGHLERVVSWERKRRACRSPVPA